MKAHDILVGDWLKVGGVAKQVERIHNPGYNVWVYFTDNTREVYTYNDDVLVINPVKEDMLRQAFGKEGEE